MLEAQVPVELIGTALERGRQQAAARPALAGRVREAVQGRLQMLETAMTRTGVATFLQAQKRFLRDHDQPGFDESLGIAEGYGLVHDDLLAYLQGNVVADMAAAGSLPIDGCTAWARADAAAGAFVVKNRDYRGEHAALQHLFRHRDPAWGGRTLLCVGSLGSPGAFSSGINSDGLAVADTQIGTRDHGVGWLRYFLMTALLRECATVDQALAFIAAVPHAGGGSLVLGDRAGAVAAVELGHRQAPHVEACATWVARTNHLTSPRLAADVLQPRDDLADSSRGRLDQVCEMLGRTSGPMAVADVRALMAGHQAAGGICRHAPGEGSRTLSCVVYETARSTLHLSHGNPCEAPWSHHGVCEDAVATPGASW